MANQIKGKFIKNGAIDGSKILIKNDQSLRALRADGAEEELFKLSSQNKFTLLKMPSISIDPTDMYDIVNKKYVDDEVYTEKTRAMMAEAELDASISAEESRAIERENVLEGMIEAESILRASEDARVLSESKAYTDLEVSEEASIRASEDVRILGEAKGYTDLEINTHVTSKLGQPSGIATLNSSGKLSSAQIPAMSLTDVYVVTTIAERDALSVQEGDVVKVTEAITSSDGTKLPRTYIFDGSVFVDITTESDVDSVNGQVGTVVLNTSHISEFGDSRYFTAAREQTLKDYIDAEDATFVKLDGSRPMSGTLDMGNNDIDYVDTIDAVSIYANSVNADSNIVTKSLSTSHEDGYIEVQTDLNMMTNVEQIPGFPLEGHRIRNLRTPELDLDAANKSYVDGEIDTHVTSKLGQPSGIATLNSSGKLSSAQIPAIALNNVYVVTTITERDALTVEEGDVVKVTEAITSSDETKLPRTYIWAVDNDTQIGSWLDIVTESDVDSVNGQVGTVVLDTDDISEGLSNKYFTDARAQSAAVVNSLSGSETNQAPSVSSVKSFVDEFGERYKIESFTVSQQTIDNSSIDLTNKAFEMSIVVSIDRLMLLDGEDYTVSIVDGKSRLTFTGSLLQGQPEALEVGDKIRVRYLKDLRV